jgi:hypothetical protein
MIHLRRLAVKLSINNIHKNDLAYEMLIDLRIVSPPPSPFPPPPPILAYFLGLEK